MSAEGWGWAPSPPHLTCLALSQASWHDRWSLRRTAEPPLSYHLLLAPMSPGPQPFPMHLPPPLHQLYSTLSTFFLPDTRKNAQAPCPALRLDLADRKGNLRQSQPGRGVGLGSQRLPHHPAQRGPACSRMLGAVPGVTATSVHVYLARGRGGF